MTRGLRTEVRIDAPPSVVWGHLTAFSAFPDWSSFVAAIEGEPRVGARLRVRLELEGRKPMTVRPRLLAVDEDRELRWLGRVGVPGVFDGEHVFRLVADGDGTRLEHEETFRGLLVPLLWPSLADATRAGFEAFNAALKRRSEA